MNERRAQMIRFQGFLLVLFALLQGFLIAAKVGLPAAQARAHLEIFFSGFLVLLVGLAAAHLKLSERAGKVLAITIIASGWVGALHALGVGTLGGGSIHVEATAAPGIEQALRAMGIIPVPLSLTAVGLMLYGLRPNASAS